MLSLCPLLLCACVFVAGSAHIDDKPFYDVQDEQLCLKLFEKFIIDHNKVYSSKEEKLKRYEIFKQDLLNINEKNRKNPLAVFDISRHSDLTEDEFLAQYTGYIPDMDLNENMLDINTVNVQNVPDSFDWRNHNAVTPVKDQGHCGSCWAFGAVGILEGQYALKHKKLLSLSEQQLVSCNFDNNGCSGGSMFGAIKYVYWVEGIQTEKDYPYASQHGDEPRCKYDETKAAVKVAKAIRVNLRNTTEDKLKGFLVENGPLGIAVGGDNLRGYTNGILSTCEVKKVNHAVLLVGYGSENGATYWLVKNSWGKKFGEEGYFKMSFGNDCLSFMNPSAVTCEVK